MTNHYMSMVGPAGGKARMDFYTAAKSCGLTTNLKQVLDAGDSRSYPGTGGKWLDMTSGGYDMFLGTTASAQSSDPTFNGTVGKRTDAEYFSVDGGDYFTYDTTQETWMKDLAKTGPSTIISVAYRGASTSVHLLANDGNTVSEHGISLILSGAVSKIVMSYVGTDNGGHGVAVGPAIPANPSGPYFMAIAYNLAVPGSYNGQVDAVLGSAGTFSVAPNTTNATNNLRIGASGDLSSIDSSGNRYYGSWIWQGTQLDGSAMLALFNTIRGRYNK